MIINRLLFSTNIVAVTNHAEKTMKLVDNSEKKKKAVDVEIEQKRELYICMWGTIRENLLICKSGEKGFLCTINKTASL